MGNKSFRHLVLLSAFLQNLLSVGYLYGFSRLLPTFVENYQWTRAEAGLIQTVFISVFSILGVVAGSFVQRYGPKYQAAAGALILAIAISLSFFSSSLVYFIFTCGVFGGIGASLSYISAAAVVSSCYQGRSRSLALTIVSSGNGVGAMAYSYLNGYLLDQYGLRGTFLISGAIVLNAFPLILIWPGETNNKVVSTESNPTDAGTTTQDTQTAIKSTKASFRHLWSNKIFVFYAMGSALFVLAQTTLVVYIVDIVLDRGGSSSTGTFALFLFSLTNTVGRFVPGLLKQIPKISVVAVPLSAAILALAASIAIVVDDSVLATLIGIAVTGVAFGTQIACMTVTTAKLIGHLHMPVAFGIIITLLGIGGVISIPLQGYVRDTTGSYTVPLLISIALLVVSNACLLVALCIRLRPRKGVQSSQPM